MSCYGIPRATRTWEANKAISPRNCFCLKCATYAYDRVNNEGRKGYDFLQWVHSKTVQEVREVVGYEEVEAFLFLVKQGKVLDPSWITEDKPLLLLCEGQLNDQIFLDHWYCELCQVRLHHLCVDY